MEQYMSDLISRQALCEYALNQKDKSVTPNDIMRFPSAQPPYVAEIEAEYQKAVKTPYIRKPLAKALHEVWKKHDREDVGRNGG